MAQRAPGAGGGGRVVIGRGGGLQLVRMEGVRTPIIDFIRGQIPLPHQRARGPRDVALPVGLGGPSVFPPRVGLPQVVQPPAGAPQTSVPPQIDRRDEPQTAQVVPMRTKLQDFLGTGLLSDSQWSRATKGETGSAAEIAALNTRLQRQANAVVPKAASNPLQTTKVISDPIVPPPVIAPPIIGPTLPTKPTGGSMDLGSIITDLGKAYITTKYAPAPTIQPFTGPVQTTPAYNALDAAGDIYDYFAGPSGEVIVKKKPCRRRRRRRRLATKSDLGDLAALKAILGNGEAFKAWIATHSR